MLNSVSSMGSMMSDSEQRLWEQLDGGALAWPTHERLIWWRGEDARTWLQGQITQDVRWVAPDEPQRFCICSATGQLLGAGLLFEWEGNLGAVVDSVTLEVLLARVNDFVILEDVQVEVSEEVVWTSQGPEATGRIVRDDTGRGGFASWGHQFPEGVRAEPPSIETAARLEAGIPRFGVDSGPKTLPPELGPWFDRTHVSHTKGCYTGQEILHRIFARGHTNKTWVVAKTNGLMQPGEWVTSVGRSPELGPLVAGIVRNEFAEVGTNIPLGDGFAEVIAPRKGQEH